MGREKRYEASYAGYVYEKPVTYWTTEEEVKACLKKVDLSSGEKIEAGGMPIISDGKIAYVDTHDGHTSINAASGMKKTICCFMPLIRVLAQAGESMILTDPKGELFGRTAGMMQAMGYRVRCLDFRTMDKDGFNILGYPATLYRNGNKDEGLKVMSDIVSILSEPQRRATKDPYWVETASFWLNGTGALMLESFPDIEQINVLNWSDFNYFESAHKVKQFLLPKMGESTIKSTLKQSISTSENTFRCVLSSASSFLSMFQQNPKLAAMVSHSTFTLEDIARPKTALYLVTDDTTSTADSILGIIISQIQSYLVDKAYHNKNGRLDFRMNFILDEFASIPIPNMDKALAAHRSRNIRYYLCVQSLALLKERYGNPEKLLSNCTSSLFLGSTELELLAEMETKLGNTCITADGREKPLCSKAELMTLKKDWNYKEGIYLNLSDGIRYSATLPSIEAYEIGDYAVPKFDFTLPKAADYPVEQFVMDIVKGTIAVPFDKESDGE